MIAPPFIAVADCKRPVRTRIIGSPSTLNWYTNEKLTKGEIIPMMSVPTFNT